MFNRQYVRARLAFATYPIRLLQFKWHVIKMRCKRLGEGASRVNRYFHRPHVFCSR